MGSVNSAFQFRAFKIDSVVLTMRQDLQTLEMTPGQDTDWAINISIRQPVHFSRGRLYVVGVDCQLNLFQKAEKERTEDNALIRIKIGGAGSFGQLGTEQLSKELEETIVRAQFPALLFAHLRAAMTNLLASAGFGSVILPLINMNEIAKSFSNIPINEID